MILLSEKEIAKKIIDDLPDYKISRILYLLKGIQIDDDIEDDLFCEKLANDYYNSDVHKTVAFETVLKEVGLTLDDLQN